MYVAEGLHDLSYQCWSQVCLKLSLKLATSESEVAQNQSVASYIENGIDVTTVIDVAKVHYEPTWHQDLVSAMWSGTMPARCICTMMPEVIFHDWHWQNLGGL